MSPPSRWRAARSPSHLPDRILTVQVMKPRGWTLIRLSRLPRPRSDFSQRCRSRAARQRSMPHLGSAAATPPLARSPATRARERRAPPLRRRSGRRIGGTGPAIGATARSARAWLPPRRRRGRCLSPMCSWWRSSEQGLPPYEAFADGQQFWLLSQRWRGLNHGLRALLAELFGVAGVPFRARVVQRLTFR